MIPNKLYFNTALKALENPANFLVWFFPWNGMVRNEDGDEIGVISQKVMERLIDHDRIIDVGKGSDLLAHEKYFKLKN
ncbi:hypothetical protein [uncultured Chryseobacterium sp.]|uniref:hypothetical protein n=1 Tax=uncultured Chryseobacterium sp. TaxID=259322 RepID=UPI0025F056ED|nr:hypothetical protein [uncultured Chryseobacterium sp.]